MQVASLTVWMWSMPVWGFEMVWGNAAGGDQRLSHVVEPKIPSGPEPVCAHPESHLQPNTKLTSVGRPCLSQTPAVPVLTPCTPNLPLSLMWNLRDCHQMD